MKRQEKTPKNRTSIFATFRRRAALERALAQFRDLRFKRVAVSIVAPETFAPARGAEAGNGGPATDGDPFFEFLEHADRRALTQNERFLVSGPISECLGESPDRGAIATALCRFGLPQYDAVRTVERLLGGDAFLEVRCPDVDLAVEATEIMEMAEADTIGAAIVPGSQ
jgi:hypothetical protein